MTKNLNLLSMFVLTIFIAFTLQIFAANAELQSNINSDNNEAIHAEIEVWAWNIAAASLKDVLPLFNAAYPNIKVNINMCQTNMQSRFLLSLSAGIGAPDISQLELGEVQKYISTKKMMDLADLAKKYEKDFIPSSWHGCIYEGRLYAIPWDVGPCAVFYKRHIFNKYGIDPNSIQTWDDYLNAGKVIYEKSNGSTKLFHLSLNSLSIMFEIMIQQNGGQLFDKDGAIAVNSPQCLAALRILRKMYESGVTSNDLIFSHSYYSSLKNDMIASYPMAAWWGGTIKDYASETAGDWGVFRLPSIEPGGLRASNYGGSILLIPDQCKHKEAAWAFIKFILCSPEIQNMQYKKYDLIPSLLSAFNDPMYDEPDPFYAGQKVRRLFTTDMEKIYILNRNKDWIEARDYVAQELSRWVSRDLRYSEQEVLERIEKKLIRRLERSKALMPDQNK